MNTQILLNKTGLKQCLLNFIKNSIESVNKKKSIKSKFIGRIIFKEVEDKSTVGFMIEDNGIGIKKEDLDNIFKFGFSTKKRGSGFGMHHCANFIKANFTILANKKVTPASFGNSAPPRACHTLFGTQVCPTLYIFFWPRSGLHTGDISKLSKTPSRLFALFFWAVTTV